MKLQPLLNKPVTVTVTKNGLKFFRDGKLAKIRVVYGRAEGLVRLGNGDGAEWFLAEKIGRAAK